MLFKAMTYNIHGGFGKGQRKMQFLVGILSSVGPQVICLQEVKQGPTRFGWENQGEWLGKNLGFWWAFAPVRYHTGGVLGNAVLSVWPIRQTRYHDLTILRRAPRGCLEVEIATPGGPLRVFNVHLGHLSRERAAQMRRLLARLYAPGGDKALPILVAGDFNSLPQSYVSHYLRKHLADVWHQVGHGRGGTFSTRLPLLRIDYIYVNQKLAPRAAQVVRPKRGRQISDHFPLLAEFDWNIS
ncbi:MAG: endonuclease/exonuclease/phosphatase family protein [Deltaproteobacteria bacterium]|nr:endonuclease/exonuclease/phosphatase family protein [Deltaproteobacteria bacterium]MBW1953217.1 endonuclease/exonuclease/phosphatase family protein [Deltaproteobacteria bacterium]MBW1985676.1 endonuclease/exonuclease/phosphatase family protein [Deltaproteobacteria bacterium]MBW2134589.1 endonuclease/exonuclease/phosphatase family protein [Deltaproteobacteria bacterium]